MVAWTTAAAPAQCSAWTAAVPLGRCSASRACLEPEPECAALSLVLDALGSVLRGGTDTERAVKTMLRHGGRTGAMADGAARGSAALAIFAVSLWRARLAFVVGQRASGRPPRGRSFDALALALLLARPPEGVSLEPPPPASWLPLLEKEVGAEHVELYRALCSAVAPGGRHNEVRWPTALVPRLAVMHSLPCGLVRDWSRRLPASELASLAAACNTRGPATLRINPERTTRARLLLMLDAAGVGAEGGRWSPWAIRLIGDRASWGGSVWSLPGWAEAQFELQDEGSQLVVRSCEAQPGETVLDFCAGRGGKTLALAAQVGPTGRVLAHDIDERALRQLAPAAVRTGVGARVEVYNGAASTADGSAGGGAGGAGAEDMGRHAATLASAYGSAGADDMGGAATPAWHSGGVESILQHASRGVDVVLVDAPCSSSGVLRRHPGLRWSGLWAGEPPRRMAALQLGILREAAAAVAPGGRLVYATCALEAADCATADAFEALHPEFVPWPFEMASLEWAEEDGAPQHGHRRTLWPHRLGTDGFFVARWRRR